MTAYLVATIKVTDPSWMADYTANVPTLIAKHGGSYLAVSDGLKRYEGDGNAPDAIVLFTFPSLDAIDAFMADPEYQPYREARRAGSSGDLFGFTPRT